MMPLPISFQCRHQLLTSLSLQEGTFCKSIACSINTSTSIPNIPHLFNKYYFILVILLLISPSPQEGESVVSVRPCLMRLSQSHMPAGGGWGVQESNIKLLHRGLQLYQYKHKNTGIKHQTVPTNTNTNTQETQRQMGGKIILSLSRRGQFRLGMQGIRDLN